MTEIYSSEPNLLKVRTEIQGKPTTPAQDAISGWVKATNDKKEYTDPKPLVFNQLDNGEYEYIIKQNDIKGYKFVEVDIKYTLDDYGDFETHDSYEVVRRLINFSELNDVLGEFAIDYTTFDYVEKSVRKIIETFCGQSFNFWEGSRTIIGQEGHLQLPQHLDRLDMVSTYSSVFGDADLVLESPGYELTDQGFGIWNESKSKTITFFHAEPRKTNYQVAGLWGYASVPTAVRQAAIELIKGYLCDDIEYRRRFIDNIRSGDVRIEFADAAYQGSTGNPIADSLLGPYVRFVYGAV